MASSRKQETASDSEGIYESFSDMVLCTVIVLITLVVVLALNVVEQLNVYIEPNHFTGGVTRPWLYLQAENVDYSNTTADHLRDRRSVFGKNPFVMVNLFSISSALAATTVEDGQVVAAKEGQSFHGQCNLTAFDFLQVAAGIDPGSFPVHGEQTALMLPKFSSKAILVEHREEDDYYAEPDAGLALRAMAMAWPVYENDLYSNRAASDYINARTKVYVEVLETDDDTHKIMIGHSVFTLPDDVENGRLGWLAGLSSGLTEVIYLGKAWSEPENNTNKRIKYFEENRFRDAADDYREFSYPEKLSESQKMLKRKVAGIHTDLSKEELDGYVRFVQAQQNISIALVDKVSARRYLPPLLAYPEAWKAYTKHCIETVVGQTPPEWLMTEFLEPLGFDQAVIRGLREDG
jgi:hypothetical protein